MGDVFGELAFVERPRWLFEHKLLVSVCKFGGCSGRVIPFPVGLPTRHVMEIFHAAIGRDNVGSRRDKIAVRREFVGYMLLGMV